MVTTASLMSRAGYDPTTSQMKRETGNRSPPASAPSQNSLIDVSTSKPRHVVDPGGVMHQTYSGCSDVNSAERIPASQAPVSDGPAGCCPSGGLLCMGNCRATVRA